MIKNIFIIVVSISSTLVYGFCLLPPSKTHEKICPNDLRCVVIRNNIDYSNIKCLYNNYIKATVYFEEDHLRSATRIYDIGVNKSVYFWACASEIITLSFSTYCAAKNKFSVYDAHCGKFFVYLGPRNKQGLISVTGKVKQDSKGYDYFTGIHYKTDGGIHLKGAYKGSGKEFDVSCIPRATPEH